MSQGIEQRLVELAKSFALNRKELLANSKAIRELHDDVDAYVDMRPLRDRYYEGEWLDEGACIRWHGWLHAVQTLFDHDDKPLDEDHAYYCMAVLLDERKTIRARGNSLKSRLRTIGEKLLRDTP